MDVKTPITVNLENQLKAVQFVVGMIDYGNEDLKKIRSLVKGVLQNGGSAYLDGENLFLKMTTRAKPAETVLQRVSVFLDDGNQICKIEEVGNFGNHPVATFSGLVCFAFMAIVGQNEKLRETSVWPAIRISAEMYKCLQGGKNIEECKSLPVVQKNLKLSDPRVLRKRIADLESKYRTLSARIKDKCSFLEMEEKLKEKAGDLNESLYKRYLFLLKRNRHAKNFYLREARAQGEVFFENGIDEMEEKADFYREYVRENSIRSRWVEAIEEGWNVLMSKLPLDPEARYCLSKTKKEVAQKIAWIMDRHDNLPYCVEKEEAAECRPEERNIGCEQGWQDSCVRYSDDTEYLIETAKEAAGRFDPQCHTKEFGPLPYQMVSKSQ